MKHDAILALFLLPLCLTVVKNIKQGKSETISLSKYDNSKSFILHIKDGNNLLTEIANYESWLERQDQVVHPYVVLCGKIDQISQSLVVLKKQTYSFPDPLQAIENCFQCLIALNSLPYVCDHIWNLIHKLIYAERNLFQPIKCPISISKFVVQLGKV